MTAKEVFWHKYDKNLTDIFLPVILKTRIAPYACFDNMPGFLRSSHIILHFTWTLCLLPNLLQQSSQELVNCCLRLPVGMLIVSHSRVGFTQPVPQLVTKLVRIRRPLRTAPGGIHGLSDLKTSLKLLRCIVCHSVKKSLWINIILFVYVACLVGSYRTSVPMLSKARSVDYQTI